MTIRIVWNGQGGELDSATVEDEGDNAISDALVKMIEGNIVAPGDSFAIEEL